MHWRTKELSETLPGAEWLPQSEACVIYDRVTPLLSQSRYGIEPTAVRDLQRISVNDAASSWLSEHIPLDGPLLLIFGKREVCRVAASDFHTHWQDMFCPSRDDVAIVGEDSDWILFYSHDDKFEYGQIPA